MRKLLVSVLSVGLLVAPTTLAFAADKNDRQVLDKSIAADFPLSKAEPLDLAQAEVHRATERVKEKQEQIREQKQEQIRERRVARQERAEAAAAAATAAEGAPAPVGSGNPASPQLEAIAQCESGGDYSTNTGNGFYGAYQFTPETWAGVGGSGLPSEASPAEQDMRAQMLLEQSGSSPWPSCG